jgi:hypothetical protein
LDEHFHTTCEDGSTEEIGDILVTLYRQCGLGDFTLSQNLRARAAARTPQVGSSKGIETGDAIDSDEDEEGITIDDINDGSIPTVFPFGGGGGGGRAFGASHVGHVGGGGGAFATSSSTGDDMDSNSSSSSSSSNSNSNNNSSAGPDPDGWETVRKGGARKKR